MSRYISLVTRFSERQHLVLVDSVFRVQTCPEAALMWIYLSDGSTIEAKYDSKVIDDLLATPQSKEGE